MGARVTGAMGKDLAIGTMACDLVAGTMLRTLDGLLPIEFLAPGDRIVCRSGARKLAAVTVSLQRDATLVRVRASTLGHDRPEQDLLLSPDTGIVIRDWRARLLYGASSAAIPAARLVDGEFVLTETHGEARLFRLSFAEDEVIYAEGLEIACPALTPAQVRALTAA